MTPIIFEIFVGGYTGASYEVRLDRHAVLYTTHGYGYAEAGKRIIVPTAADWARFWETLDNLGVWSWEPEYPDPGVVDGTHWNVHIELGNRRVVSHGANNYPGGEDSPVFDRLLAAVSALLGGVPFE